jgi:2-methylcitrate dehydratase PrpD
VDNAYPARWIGKVIVETVGGLTLYARVDEPRGDPGNTLTRAELKEKALRLADYSGAATHAEMATVFAKIADLADTESMGAFLTP